MATYATQLAVVWVRIRGKLLKLLPVLVLLALLVMRLSVRVLLVERSAMGQASSSGAGYPLAVVTVCLNEGYDE